MMLKNRSWLRALGCLPAAPSLNQTSAAQAGGLRVENVFLDEAITGYENFSKTR
jgi:hypothetical protein